MPLMTSKPASALLFSAGNVDMQSKSLALLFCTKADELDKKNFIKDLSAKR